MATIYKRQVDSCGIKEMGWSFVWILKFIILKVLQLRD